MRGRRFSPADFPGALKRRLWRARKEMRARRRPARDKLILSVLGCQRSGTTLLTRILDQDPESKVFGEFSRLSSRDEDGIRLNSLESVARALDAVPFPFIILKPLVESQNAVPLLERLPNSRALWLYRSCEDVVASNLQMFGERNGIRNLRRALHGHERDWRAERISPSAKRIAERNYSETMSPYDAAALFWYIRNDLYFDQLLNDRHDVLLVKYEQLVGEPGQAMRRIYDFVGRIYPGDHTIGSVSSRSIGKGDGIALSDEVEEACREMLVRLDAVHDLQVQQRMRSSA